MASRESNKKRNTKETKIEVSLKIDGAGKFTGKTGVGFFDHMLELFARHSLCDLTIKAAGDLEVDAHHTIEDVGIVLGKAIDEALSERAGIQRYGWALIPMDEALCEVAVDLGGRAYFVYNVDLPGRKFKVGEFDIELVQEFFQAIAFNAKMNLHINLRAGSNLHHIAEAIFKSFARAFDLASRIDPRVKGAPTTKGTLC